MININSLLNGVRKMLYLPFKYKMKDDYNAEKYWYDRFKKHGNSLKGVGHEGISHSGNLEMYNRAAKLFKELILDLPINIEQKKVLEVGPGIGYYTNILYNELNVSRLSAIDITDYYFSELNQKYPYCSFIKLDISNSELIDKYDIIIMIDVVEHIVTEKKLRYTINNIKNSLNKGGYLILSGYSREKSNKNLFYFRNWNKKYIMNELKDFTLIKEVPFRNNNLMIVKKYE